MDYELTKSLNHVPVSINIDLSSGQQQSILDSSNSQPTSLAFAYSQSCRDFPDCHSLPEQFSRTHQHQRASGPSKTNECAEQMARVYSALARRFE